MKKFWMAFLAFLLILSSLGAAPSLSSAASGFAWPIENGSHEAISSSYGQRWGKMHHGIDLVKDGSAPIKASAPGTVIYSGFHINSNGTPGFGNFVAIRHSINGVSYVTRYAHMKNKPSVSVNQTVSQGQVIGEMGSTGHSTGKHLHFEILVGTTNMWDTSKSTDPYKFLSGSTPTAPTDDRIMFDGLELRKGQIGVITVEKPINLWTRNEDNSLKFEKVLQPGNKYRVYSYDDLHGGQYDVGDNHYVTKMDGYITYRTPSKAMFDLVNNTTPTGEKVYWEGLEMRKGQIGLVEIIKPINLWKRDANDNLTIERVLKPGEKYRVYGYDEKHGGQYDLGSKLWVTKMDGYINYKTPSQDKIDEFNRTQ
ncbi:M23 family metallopeptidase [Bacillus infantis]|uniref:M23 family metallopeptidase n=1 Tax=Bacillus infantis TaxID=324767 RepID=UPI0020036A9D|nr:M23 family metallopeptidase [Bacillus infantis]MCK6207064.1 M23 family metallopeptidase [Bacillus infantis]